ncbi:hypothetical protein [Boudabousia marimammalium]|uniref:Uncharacterized protein n=1 Tax=Boudabousia marimammalium TaxID=156892 RepID=A0A1Q5PM91_9ACTO|nr:hypothetical protein [Boudabousia marimammalium]OKL48661.1 hypothetical protein BM477_05530 [Boudabousia marimammalium]
MADKYFAVRSGATALRNETVHDKSLSFTALGLLTTMLSMPPDAPLGYRQFLGRGSGQSAILKAMKELEVAGYRWRFSTRNSDGMIRQVVIVFDVPTTEEQARAALTKLGTKPHACVSQPARVDDSLTPIDIDELSRVIDSLDIDGTQDLDQLKKEAIEQATKDNERLERQRIAQHQRDTIAQEQAARTSNSPSRENQRNGTVTPLRENQREGTVVPLRGNQRNGENAPCVENNATENESPTSPLREFPLQRHTVARSTHAQLISKDINSKKDKSFLTSQHEQPDSDQTAGEGRNGIYIALTEEQAQTAYACLPGHMKVTEIPGLIKIWAQVERLLNAGWTVEQIHNHLDAKPLPAEVIYLPALIASRLKDMLPAPPQPCSVSKAAKGYCNYHRNKYHGICDYCESERKAGRFEDNSTTRREWLETGCPESVEKYRHEQAG